jgi:hypothetical protein
MLQQYKYRLIVHRCDIIEHDILTGMHGINITDLCIASDKLWAKNSLLVGLIMSRFTSLLASSHPTIVIFSVLDERFPITQCLHLSDLLISIVEGIFITAIKLCGLRKN